MKTSKKNVKEKCVRCNGEVVKDRCADVTCPFSDCSQSDPRGWTGHPALSKELERVYREYDVAREHVVSLTRSLVYATSVQEKKLLEYNYILKQMFNIK